MILRPDVYVARVGDDVVLLDTGVGEYLCLVDAASAFELQPAGAIRVLDAELAAEVEAAGLCGNGRALRTRTVKPAALDIADDHSARAPAEGLANGVASFVELLRAYYGRPFARLIRYADKRRRSDAPALTAALANQVQAFRKILPWSPFQGVCFYRSFFLLAFLRRRGFDAAWVFGVRTWPFEAHCWLQVDDVVLDDRLDHVRTFTPILAV